MFIGEFSSDYGCYEDENREEMLQYEFNASRYEYEMQQYEKQQEKEDKFEKEFKKLQERVLGLK